MDRKALKWFGWIILGVMLLVFFNASSSATKSADPRAQATETISFDKAQELIKKEPQSITNVLLYTDANGNVREAVVLQKDNKSVKVLVPGNAGTERLLNDLSANNVPHEAKETPAPSSSPLSSILNVILNLAFMIVPFLLIFWLFSRMQGGAGGIQRQIGQSGARKVEPAADRKTFEDVAGADEAKRELMEIVDYLKDPGLLRQLGGKPPKGVLLIGSPGNGKTLLAKAVAGEAGVPFFAISASQFVEMFVGVGAARVREFFDTARKNSPAVLFIDEIDAVGRQRGAGIGGGHDEREQTLNQLLVEMDGFTPNTALVLMAATNRPDVLDPALLRPGRFDLQVSVDHPDLFGREMILKVHTRKKKLAQGVDLKVIAELTPGFSGAELEGLTDQAAIVAARRIKAQRAELMKRGMGTQEAAKAVPIEINMADLSEGIDRVQMGPAKEGRAARMSEKDMKNTAYHEIGHAWISEVMYELEKGGDPVTKITIVPRARALGYTQSLPKGDRYNYTREELLARIMMAMGGRVAQEIFLNTVDTGAQNDFQQAKNIAYRMVTEFGMSDLGPIFVSDNTSSPFLGRAMAMGGDAGPALRDQIDKAWTKIVNDCYAATREIILKDQVAFRQVAEALLKKETLLREEWLALYSHSRCATCGPEVIAEAMAKCAADLDHCSEHNHDAVSDAAVPVQPAAGDAPVVAPESGDQARPEGGKLPEPPQKS